jgi:hypothetical protein
MAGHRLKAISRLAGTLNSAAAFSIGGLVRRLTPPFWWFALMPLAPDVS